MSLVDCDISSTVAVRMVVDGGGGGGVFFSSVYIHILVLWLLFCCVWQAGDS